MQMNSGPHQQLPVEAQRCLLGIWGAIKWVGSQLTMPPPFSVMHVPAPQEIARCLHEV